ncbi:MAG: hypothetical protein RIR70_907 [Pseudomonadota bacterium]|jgi:5,10-methenyltetrahydrofolate synthetase
MTRAKSTETTLEFREKLRREMLARRAAIDAPTRALQHSGLGANLSRLIDQLAPRTIGFCWPWQGEFDARDIIAQWLAQDRSRTAALPVIEALAAPMKFFSWTPQSPMRDGRFGIPVPEAGQAVIPDLFILPVVAADQAGFRLGYGGGYFDRTLAALVPRPTAVGVGFDFQVVDTIFPQPWDEPLDWLVTESASLPLRRNPLS